VYEIESGTEAGLEVEIEENQEGNENEEIIW
jgi:hypothetical protein